MTIFEILSTAFILIVLSVFLLALKRVAERANRFDKYMEEYPMGELYSAKVLLALKRKEEER